VRCLIFLFLHFVWLTIVVYIFFFSQDDRGDGAFPFMLPSAVDLVRFSWTLISCKSTMESAVP